MKEDFVMRGQTASGGTETLNFGGPKDGYGFLLTEFSLYPSTNIASEDIEMTGTVTAGKTAVSPVDPDFNDEGLIATGFLQNNNKEYYPLSYLSVINDLFVITQDLILMVQNDGGSNVPINWQCRFKPVKLDTANQALTNYRQFMIFDG